MWDAFTELWATQGAKGVPRPGVSMQKGPEAGQHVCPAAMALPGPPQAEGKRAARQGSPVAHSWGSGWAGVGSCVSSGTMASCPQVPIIPVVYSSFSSFYNYKTKFFTSGSGPPPPTGPHTRA